MKNYSTYYAAAELALANFLDADVDDVDQDMINLVANCCVQAIEVLPNWSYFNDLLEKSSTYVQCDLNEVEMSEYVGELELQLEESGLL
jgi:hypothetical protein